MRILIVEDEKKTASFLQKGLSENEFIVDLADNGNTGLNLAKKMDYDVIILDIMLPGRDGWSILQELRDYGIQTPILFLTARDAVHDRVKGLDLGADDYLVKPFAFSELLARIRVLLRRGKERKSEVFQVADLTIDLVQHRAVRSGKILDLTPKEFLLLSLFTRHTGEVLSRSLIMDQIWNINFNNDTNVLDVAVRRLRRKVDEPFREKLIHTVRGVGYVMETR